MRARPIAMAIAIAATTATFAVGHESTAHADVVKSDIPIIAATTVSILGGITTSIAAIIYAFDHRAFDSGWVVASLFSSAFCTAFTGAILVSTFSDGLNAANGIGILFFTAVTAWPFYWTLKGWVLEDVDP